MLRYLQQCSFVLADDIFLLPKRWKTHPLVIKMWQMIRVKLRRKTYSRCSFGSELFEIFKSHHFSHDEAFLEISMNSSGSLRRFRAFLERSKAKWCNLALNQYHYLFQYGIQALDIIHTMYGYFVVNTQFKLPAPASCPGCYFVAPPIFSQNKNISWPYSVLFRENSVRPETLFSTMQSACCSSINWYSI